MTFNLPIINQFLPPVLNALLVALLAYLLADLAWQLIPSDKTPPVPVASKNNIKAVQQIDYGNKIATRHVFGKLQAPAAIDVDLVNKAPETQLDLVLKGVLLFYPKKPSQALIAIAGAEQKPFLINDTITGDASLQDIFADRVIIKYRGRHETLMLEGVEKTKIEQQAPPVVAQQQQPQVGVALGDGDYENPAINANTILAPAAASKMRSQFINDPRDLMSQVNLRQKVLADGRVGMQLNPKGSGELFYQLGLEDNDIVLSVNGSPVTDTQAMNSLQNADQYNVNILRGGMEIPLTIRFK